MRINKLSMMQMTNMLPTNDNKEIGIIKETGEKVIIVDVIDSGINPKTGKVEYKYWVQEYPESFPVHIKTKFTSELKFTGTYIKLKKG